MRSQERRLVRARLVVPKHTVRTYIILAILRTLLMVFVVGGLAVVSQPLENEKPYGVPSGVYSSGEKHNTDASDVSSCEPNLFLSH